MTTPTRPGTECDSCLEGTPHDDLVRCKCGDQLCTECRQFCAGCKRYFCDDCIDWCAPDYDPPNGDYFCEDCQDE